MFKLNFHKSAGMSACFAALKSFFLIHFFFFLVSSLKKKYISVWNEVLIHFMLRLSLKLLASISKFSEIFHKVSQLLIDKMYLLEISHLKSSYLSLLEKKNLVQAFVLCRLVGFFSRSFSDLTWLLSRLMQTFLFIVVVSVLLCSYFIQIFFDFDLAMIFSISHL